MFDHWALRTTDVDSALRFYSDALGRELPLGPRPGAVEVWPLHERARSLGVPAHWLGCVGVADMESVVAQVVAHGGTPLGPPVVTPTGRRYAALKDPWGAVLAVGTKNPDALTHSAFVWHQLHTTNLQAARAMYGSIFGWRFRDSGFVSAHAAATFGLVEGGEEVGGVVDTASFPGAHPQWLFCFSVADLGATLERVRVSGGRALEPVQVAMGSWVAACEDPQGAAFGLSSSAAS